MIRFTAFVVLLAVCCQSVFAASEGASVIVIQKQPGNVQPPAQNFTKTTNGTEFPLEQTEAPETVPSSSLVLEHTATRNSLLTTGDAEKPSTRITIQSVVTTEKTADEESETVYDREIHASSTQNSTVVVISLTTTPANTTTVPTTTTASTELNLIPPANVNSSIAFMNETKKAPQIIIK